MENDRRNLVDVFAIITHAEMPMGFVLVDRGRKGISQIKDEVKFRYAR